MSKIGSATIEINADDKASKVLGKVQGKMEGAKAKLQKIGGGMKSTGKTLSKYVTAPLVGVGGAAVGAAKKTGDYADDVINTSKKVGMGTKEYQEMTYALKQTGLEQDQSDRALGRLNQRMGRAADGNEKYSKALQAVGITQEDLENGTYSTDEAFQKIIGSLHDIEDPTERSAKASEIFGTNMSRQLMPAIEAGTGSLKKYMKGAHDAGQVMGGSALDNSQKLKFAFDDLKDRTVGIVHEVGGKLAPIFTEKLIPAVRDHVLPMFESMGDKLVSAVEWFAGLSTKMQAAVAVFTGVATAAGPLLVVLGSIVSAVGKALPLFSKIGPVLGALTSPVGLIVAAIAALTAGFITAYKKSETFRNIVNGLKDAFMNAISGIKQFLTTNPQIQAFIDSVKGGFKAVWDTVKSVFGSIASFIQSQITKIKAFWDENGTQLLEAFRNIFDGIWAVVKPIIKKIRSIFETTFPIIKDIVTSVFTTVLEVIENAWNTIKGIISGYTDIILGTIKTFASLFTGDWEGMWDGIKQIASGVLKVIKSIVKGAWTTIKTVTETIWEGIKGFFSTIWKGIKGIFKSVIKLIVKFAETWWGNFRDNVKAIFKGVKSFFSTIWSRIKTVFKTVIKAIVNFAETWWDNFRDNIKSVFKGIKKFFSTIWSGIKGIFRTVIKSVVKFVKNRFDTMKGNIETIWGGIKSITKSAWEGIKKFIIDPVKSGVKWALDKFGSFKKSVSDIFGKIKDGISEKVTGMIDLIKDMPGKMKKGITDGAGAIKKGFLFVAARMVDGIFAGVNGIIDGVNWAWHLLGGKKNKFDTLTPSADWYKKAKAHAKGTDSHPGGVAKVNDGKGSNSGQELIQTPDGTTGMFKGKNVYADLPKGTQVLSAKDTKQTIPQYAWGTKAWDKAVSGVKATGGAIKSGAQWTGKKAKAAGKKVKDGTLWLGKKAKDGAKAVFNTAMKAVGVKTPGKKNNVMGLMRRSFLTVKDRAIGKLKDRIKDKQEEEEGGGGINVFSGKGWTKTSGYGNRSNPTGSGGQFHHGIDFAAPMGTAVKSATSGKMKQAGFGGPGSGYGGYGKVASVMSNGFEILYTHLSNVLKKTGDKVKAGDKIGEVGTTGDSTGPHVHFEARKNGELKNTINPSKFLESSGSASGKLGNWIKQGMKKAGVSGSNWSSGLNYIIGKESSGNPKAIGAPTTTGTAKGLMQLKDMNMSGNPFDPVNNILNGIKYVKGRYGSIGNAVDWWKAHHWYAKGGFVNKPQTAMLGENNKREAVIPLQSRKYMKPFSDAVAANLNMGAEASGGAPNVTVNNTFNGTGEIKPSVRRRQQKKSLQDIGKEMRGL